jgi:solute carrier family 25 citrate transporter 1
LYKGLVPVVCGIIPKMAIRFSSFEYYKQLMADENGKVSTGKVSIWHCTQSTGGYMDFLFLF